MTISENTDLDVTCLHGFHLQHGAKMAGFAGYDMPLYYPDGALKEHLACRQSSALFDVSHMGQLDLCPATGDTRSVLHQLEQLIPANLVDLPEGQQRYGLLLNEKGGIIDDLMVMHFPGLVRLVVNAACVQKDVEWLSKHLSDIEIKRQQRALVALQGPAAASVLLAMMPAVSEMRFMQIKQIDYDGRLLQLSRSGYTGEDGFEISLPEDMAVGFVQQLCQHDGVNLAGLVARDSLRLEAGLSLYGQDMDEDISVLSAGLEWAIPKIRRAGGARAGGFIGEETTFDEFENGPPFRRVAALVPKGVPVRAGTKIFTTQDSSDAIGFVTSGSPAPNVGQPVAMARIEHDAEQGQLPLFAEVRGKYLALTRTTLPFFAHRYHKV